jgi:hypothetical protein
MRLAPALAFIATLTAGPGGAPQVAGRRRMSLQRTSVGLDVHARSAAALDAVSGQVTRARLCPDHAEIARWIAGPARVEVVHEARPPGLAIRALFASKTVAEMEIRRWAGVGSVL